MKIALPSLFVLAACNTAPPGPLVTGLTNTVVVTSRDSMNVAGTINTVDRTSKKVTTAVDTTLDADHIVKASDGKLFVLNRTKGNVRVYDGNNLAVLGEVKVGDDAHPAAMGYVQDLMPLPGLALGPQSEVVVSLAGNLGDFSIAIVDWKQPAAGVKRWISVPAAAADPDGKPEPYPLHLCQGRVYAGLGDYDSTSTFAPTGPGRLAVIDPTQAGAVDIITLAHENPTQIVQTGSDCTQVLVVGSGPFGVAPGAMSGLDRVDLAGKKVSSVADATTLGGVPNALTLRSATLGFLVINYDLQTVNPGGYQILARSRMLALDPSTGAVLGDASDKAGYIAFAGVSPDAELWFGSDNLASVDTSGNLPVGVWVAPATATKPSYRMLDVGQKPYGIAFP